MIISLFTCSAIFSVKWRPQIPFLPCSIQQTTLHQTVLPCIFSPSPEPFDLQRYWTSVIEEIDGELQKAIPRALPTNSTGSNEILSVAKDKGASPIICIAACEAVGGSKEQALPTACALQMIHTASQIHHDLPCIDDQPIRRGQPSTHIVFGVDMAVWVADALFPLGFEYIVSATSQGPVDSVRGIAQGMQGPWDLRGSLLGSIWTWNGEENL